MAGDRQYTGIEEFNNRFAAFIKAFKEEGFPEDFVWKTSLRSYKANSHFWAASARLKVIY